MSSEKLASIESNLNSIEKKLSRGNALTCILGAIMLGAMLFYFVYGYRQINDIMEPATIADVGQAFLEDNIPTIKTTVQDGVEENAPVWAASLSQQAIDSLPELRVTLTDYSLEQVDTLVTDYVTLSETAFDDIIERNRDEIQSAIDELKENKEVSKDLSDAMEKEFEAVLEADLKGTSEELLKYAVQMSSKMKKLFEGKGLSESEELERQAMMLLRRIQLMETKE